MCVCWYLLLDRIWSRTRGKALKQRRDEDRVDEWPQSLGSWAGAGLGLERRGSQRQSGLEARDGTAKRTDEREKKKRGGE